MRPLILPAGCALTLLSACSGVAGTTSIKGREGAGVQVITVQTCGLDVRTAPGCRGLTLGMRRLTLVYEALAEQRPEQRRFGWCRLPGKSPLFVHSEGWGLELACSADYYGIHAGRWLRAAARLPCGTAALLRVQTGGPDGGTFSFSKPDNS